MHEVHRQQEAAVIVEKTEGAKKPQILSEWLSKQKTMTSCVGAGQLIMQGDKDYEGL